MKMAMQQAAGGQALRMAESSETASLLEQARALRAESTKRVRAQMTGKPQVQELRRVLPALVRSSLEASLQAAPPDAGPEVK